MRTMRAAVAVAALALVVACQPEVEAPARERVAPAAVTSEAPRAEAPRRLPSRAAKPLPLPSRVKERPRRAPLLMPAPGGDGDSWKDTAGVEYRLGLINTPELSECLGETASAKRKELTAAGFRARAYATDTYGRRVAVVHLADGRNLNVWLAARGYADDRYLARFRHENPSLAGQLDAAFAAAKRKRLGVWGAACAAPPAPQRIGGSACDPSYPGVCIPPGPPDLDCGDVTHRRFDVRPPDPHRFDSDGDGIGCESG